MFVKRKESPGPDLKIRKESLKVCLYIYRAYLPCGLRLPDVGRLEVPGVEYQSSLWVLVSLPGSKEKVLERCPSIR